MINYEKIMKIINNIDVLRNRGLSIIRFRIWYWGFRGDSIQRWGIWTIRIWETWII